MSLLGLDIGTSGCKAVTFSEDGQVLALAYEEYDYQRPQPGWAELDPVDIWSKVKHCITHVTAATRSSPVRALSISSMGEAMVPVSHDRRILGPSLTNADGRGEEYLAGLRLTMSDEQLYAINGNPLGNHYSLTKLMWMRDHRPEVYQAAEHFLHWSSFIGFMLGADACVDYSLANRTLLFDLEQQTWSGTLVQWADLDMAKLPKTVPSGTVIGQVSSALAQELGLPKQTPIVSGAHDQCANAIGCGVIHEGQAMYGMGTFVCAVPVFRQRRETHAMLARGINTEHHAFHERFVSFIYNHGGSLLKWYRDTFAALERQMVQKEGGDIYARLIAEMPENPSKVMVLPHFAPTGPPDFISDSSGVICGIRLDTTRGDVLKGILQGITCYIRACLETLPAIGIAIDNFRAVGGGSKSDAWIQLTADIFARPIIRPEITEAGALGAAILAGAATGVFNSIEEGCQTMIRLGRSFEPQSKNLHIYDDYFSRYKELWPMMSSYLRHL